MSVDGVRRPDGSVPAPRAAAQPPAAVPFPFAGSAGAPPPAVVPPPASPPPVAPPPPGASRPGGSEPGGSEGFTAPAFTSGVLTGRLTPWQVKALDRLGSILGAEPGTIATALRSGRSLGSLLAERSLGVTALAGKFERGFLLDARI